MSGRGLVRAAEPLEPLVEARDECQYLASTRDVLRHGFEPCRSHRRRKGRERPQVLAPGYDCRVVAELSKGSDQRLWVASDRHGHVVCAKSPLRDVQICAPARRTPWSAM